MYMGWPSLCLSVKDLAAAERFYRTIGMEVLPKVSAPGVRTVLRSGAFRIGLFHDLGTNSINFRGADVEAAHAEMTRQFPEIPGTPNHYVPGAANGATAEGVSWLTADPDGNPIFFDTNATEHGEAFTKTRQAQILRDAESELVKIGASAECLEAFRNEVLARFCEEI